MGRNNGTITFTVGAVAGTLGGFMLGIFFGKYALQLFTLLYNVIDRKGTPGSSRMKFEWLQQ